MLTKENVDKSLNIDDLAYNGKFLIIQIKIKLFGFIFVVSPVIFTTEH